MYRKGDYKRISDRGGRTYYRSQMKREWTGLLVGKDQWEPKHPQLELRSVEDDQTVDDPRPKNSLEYTETTLSSAASKYDQTISVASANNISVLTSIGITLNSGIIFWTFSTSTPSGTDISLNEYLNGPADSGNTVYVASNDKENFINMTHAERLAALNG